MSLIRKNLGAGVSRGCVSKKRHFQAILGRRTQPGGGKFALALVHAQEKRGRKAIMRIADPCG
jgi:hypothetical protein